MQKTWPKIKTGGKNSWAVQKQNTQRRGAKQEESPHCPTISKTSGGRGGGTLIFFIHKTAKKV